MLAIRFQWEKEEEGSGEAETLKLFTLVFAGIALILAGAELVVRSSVFFAGFFGISEFVVGLTMVAFGTTVPDKVITVVGSLKGQSGVVMANLIGSNIFNLLCVLGIAALVTPLHVDDATLRFDLPVLVGVTWFVIALIFRGRVRRGTGIILMLTYLVYLTYNFTFK